MTQYRKKPVVVEATQWHKNGDHPQDGHETFKDPETGEEHLCEGKVVRYYRRPGEGQRECEHCGQTMHHHGWIDTLEGGHVVCPGDFIITGIQGERYPCKPDIFRETYDPVGDDDGSRPYVVLVNREPDAMSLYINGTKICEPSSTETDVVMSKLCDHFGADLEYYYDQEDDFEEFDPEYMEVHEEER